MNNPNGTSHSKHTIVEEGTHFKGTLASTCPIDVRGRVEGEIETPALTVSQSGAVHGRVKVGEVRSEGELSGEFDADSDQIRELIHPDDHEELNRVFFSAIESGSPFTIQHRIVRPDSSTENATRPAAVSLPGYGIICAAPSVVRSQAPPRFSARRFRA